MSRTSRLPTRWRAGLLLRSAYALCLLVGASTHLVTLLEHGALYDYGGVNLFTQVFWNSLVVADPLAAACLVVRPRLGLILTAGIIGLDVLNNLAVYADKLAHGPRPGPFYPAFLGLQLAFLIFLAATIRIPWSERPVV